MQRTESCISECMIEVAMAASARAVIPGRDCSKDGCNDNAIRYSSRRFDDLCAGISVDDTTNELK